jgi:hypothetical protein
LNGKRCLKNGGVDRRPRRGHCRRGPIGAEPGISLQTLPPEAARQQDAADQRAYPSEVWTVARFIDHRWSFIPEGRHGQADSDPLAQSPLRSEPVHMVVIRVFGTLQRIDLHRFLVRNMFDDETQVVIGISTTGPTIDKVVDRQLPF